MGSGNGIGSELYSLMPLTDVPAAEGREEGRERMAQKAMNTGGREGRKEAGRESVFWQRREWRRTRRRRGGGGE